MEIMKNQNNQEIWDNVKSLSIIERLDLIKDYLQSGNALSYETIEFESINTICHEILSKE